MKNFLLNLIFFLLLIFSFKKTYAKTLNCADIKKITQDVFKGHYSVSNFDEGFINKWFDKLIGLLDPQKIYFLAKDLLSLKRIFEKELGKLILENDCKFMEKIYSIYAYRKENFHSFYKNNLQKKI